MTATKPKHTMQVLSLFFIFLLALVAACTSSQNYKQNAAAADQANNPTTPTDQYGNPTSDQGVTGDTNTLSTDQNTTTIDNTGSTDNTVYSDNGTTSSTGNTYYMNPSDLSPTKETNQISDADFERLYGQNSTYADGGMNSATTSSSSTSNTNTNTY